ncbi:hypothetical protein C6P72_09940, partial [Burkholderia gladioli]
RVFLISGRFGGWRFVSGECSSVVREDDATGGGVLPLLARIVGREVPVPRSLGCRFDCEVSCERALFDACRVGGGGVGVVTCGDVVVDVSGMDVGVLRPEEISLLFILALS